MNAPVLTDLMGNDFTVGDRVVYAATNGIRVGKVEWIKDTVHLNTSGSVYKVYINMSEHHDKTGPAKMRAPKVGYEYRKGGMGETYHHFLKVSAIT